MAAPTTPTTPAMTCTTLKALLWWFPENVAWSSVGCNSLFFVSRKKMSIGICKVTTEKGRRTTYCVSAAKAMAMTENRKNNRIWGRCIVKKRSKKKRERRETLHTASGSLYFALYWPKPCTPETQERLADPQIKRLDPQCTEERATS